MGASLEHVPANKTDYTIQWETYDGSGGSVAPSSAYANTDLNIYKDDSATQRSSQTAGITVTSPFDSLTGVHQVVIDLSDNTDAGFYAVGSWYRVVLASAKTVDSQTLNGVEIGRFRIVPAEASAGVPDANVASMDADTLTATAIQNDAITAAKIATDAIDADALATDAVNEINATVDTALVDIGLDHLVAAAVSGSDITDDSIIAKLVSKEATADWDDFNNTTDSLQALVDVGVAVASLGTDAITAASIATAAAEKLMDIMARRTSEKIEDSAFGDSKSRRSLLGAIQWLTHKWELNSNNVIVVLESDDATTAYTRTPTVDRGAKPITGLD